MTRGLWITNAAGIIGCTAIGFAALFGATSWSAQTEMTVAGASLEVVGIALVALDFWYPALLQAYDWLTRWGIRNRLSELYWNVAGRLTGTRAHVSVSVFAVPPESSADAPAPTIDVGPVSSFAEVNDRLRVFADRLTAVETQDAARDAELRRVIVKLELLLRAEIRESIRRSKDQYLPWRVIGLFVALSGTVVLAAANLV